MASPETQKLRERIDEIVKELNAALERDKELSLEVKRHLATLRRLAGSV